MNKPVVAGLGAYTPATLSPKVIANDRDTCLKTGVAAQTVRHELGQLHRALKWAAAEQGVPLPTGLPTASVKRPPQPRGRNRRVSDDESKAILKATQSQELRWIIKLAVETAMRRGELVSLRWSNVDLKHSRRRYKPQLSNYRREASVRAQRRADRMLEVRQYPEAAFGI
jgi:integrase